MSKVWFNGALIDKAEAHVSILDHGFLYCDGAWEPFRLFHGKPFAAAHHLELLFQAAGVVGIDMPLSMNELSEAITQMARANNRDTGYGRVIVTRGAGTIGPDPRKVSANVLIVAAEYQPFPTELYSHGLHVVVSPMKLDLNNPAHRFRTLSQLHVVQAKRFSLQHGCLEAIFQNQCGEMIGTTEGALFIVKNGAIVVASGHVVEATAHAAAALAAENGIVVAECGVSLPDLLVADEAFIAGTAAGVIGLNRANGTTIGSGSEGPITRMIREQFSRLTHGEVK